MSVVPLFLFTMGGAGAFFTIRNTRDMKRIFLFLAWGLYFSALSVASTFAFANS